MERVFGLPADPLAMVLAVLVAVTAIVVSVLGFRHPVFFKMGMRNISRRRARTALILAGLMLGTAILASALLTGDTISRAVRSSVVESLGVTDEVVVAGGQYNDLDTGQITTAVPYFDQASAVEAVNEATKTLPVDGVAGVIVEPIAGQHLAAGRTEPRIGLFAPGPEGAPAFGLADAVGLAADEVLINTEAADELAAAAGDRIELLIGGHQATFTVVAVGEYQGLGTTGSGVVMPLTAAQSLLAREGQINQVLVSNAGNATGGVDHTDAVVAAVDEAVASLGLSAEPVKQDGLDAADATGNIFVQLFTTFGSFSMAAGILLIFLIFVMLATERRPEMGMARAVGTQRRHLVQTFVFEGAGYDVMAAAIGVLLGIVVSYVMVKIVGAAFTDLDVELTYSLSARSLVIAYGLGVMLTLAVVTGSAWRVSRLNIVGAIRDIPEVAPRKRRRGWLTVAIVLPIGTLLAVSGATSQSYLPWMVGLSTLVMMLIPVLRLLGSSDRVAFTVAGLLLIALWLLPLSFFDRFFGEMSMDFSIWIIGGLVLVVAATWIVTFNADVMLSSAARVTSPVAQLRPVVKMAVAYPLRSRFRTGVTMAMFMLVVFTLVTGTVIPGAFVNAFDDVETFGGGFDVRVSTAPAAATANLRADLPAELSSDVTIDAAQSFVPLEARQDDVTSDFAAYPLRGVDDGFLRTTTYSFMALGHGYESAGDVWSALEADPTLAVVDAYVAPRRANWGFAVLPDFQLSGFYADDGVFDPVPITVRDPQTGGLQRLTVIGVLNDNLPFEMAGVTVSQRALAAYGERAVPTMHHLVVTDDADPEEVASEVEAALLSRGAEAESYASVLDDAVGGNMLFIRLVQGFMALGLVIGVAALGVISARAVVERRQQLGMLRAIGFQPGMISQVLLIESSIVSLTAIVAGSSLGLLVSYNVIDDSRQQPGYGDLAFTVPWLGLLLIFAAVFASALITTYAPARRASRIYPAEALRYQ